jgi:hypothetical protein
MKRRPRISLLAVRDVVIPAIGITVLAVATTVRLVWFYRSMNRHRGEAEGGRMVEPSTTEPLAIFIRERFTRPRR